MKLTHASEWTHAAANMYLYMYPAICAMYAVLSCLCVFVTRPDKLVLGESHTSCMHENASLGASSVHTPPVGRGVDPEVAAGVASGAYGLGEPAPGDVPGTAVATGEAGVPGVAVGLRLAGGDDWTFVGLPAGPNDCVAGGVKTKGDEGAPGEAADGEGVATGAAVLAGVATGEAVPAGDAVGKAVPAGVAAGEAVAGGVAAGLRAPGTPVSCRPGGVRGDAGSEGDAAVVATGNGAVAVAGVLAGVVPVGEGVVPVGEGVVPVGERVVPVGEGVVPIGEGVVPVGKGVVPVGEGVLGAYAAGVGKEGDVTGVIVAAEVSVGVSAGGSVGVGGRGMGASGTPLA